MLAGDPICWPPYFHLATQQTLSQFGGAPTCGWPTAKDGDARSCGGDCSPPSADRGGGSSLRRHGRHSVSRRPEGRVGGKGADRQSRQVPTETNLRDEYESWGEPVDACDEFRTKVNGRPHRVTRRAPVGMLGDAAAASAPRCCVHCGVRGDPQIGVVVDHLLGRCCRFGSPHTRGPGGVVTDRG